MIGIDVERKLNNISLSDNTVQRRILDLSEDIKIQTVEQIKNLPQDGFAYNWMNLQMLHHVLNSLFLFGTSINWILKMNFYSVNTLTCKHVESIFTTM